MVEARIHGRGGQGTVLASLALARAAFLGGHYVQSFPEFGVERRGAPVAAFLRISETPILIRSKIYAPNYVMVLDASLLEVTTTLEGLNPNGLIIINQANPSTLEDKNRKIALVDASLIALNLGLGSPTTPIVNTAMTGAFAKATNIITMENLEKAIAETFPENAEKNIAAARQGYEQCQLL